MEINNRFIYRTPKIIIKISALITVSIFFFYCFYSSGWVLPIYQEENIEKLESCISLRCQENVTLSELGKIIISNEINSLVGIFPTKQAAKTIEWIDFVDEKLNLETKYNFFKKFMNPQFIFAHLFYIFFLSLHFYSFKKYFNVTSTSIIYFLFLVSPIMGNFIFLLEFSIVILPTLYLSIYKPTWGTRIYPGKINFLLKIEKCNISRVLIIVSIFSFRIVYILLNKPTSNIPLFIPECISIILFFIVLDFFNLSILNLKPLLIGNYSEDARKYFNLLKTIVRVEGDGPFLSGNLPLGKENNLFYTAKIMTVFYLPYKIEKIFLIRKTITGIELVGEFSKEQFLLITSKSRGYQTYFYFFKSYFNNPLNVVGLLFHIILLIVLVLTLIWQYHRI